MGENTEIKEIYELGERPPIGIIPKNMHAFWLNYTFISIG